MSRQGHVLACLLLAFCAGGGGGARAEVPCTYDRDGLLLYDVTGGPMREAPALRIAASGAVSYRAGGARLSGTATKQTAAVVSTDIPEKDAEALLRQAVLALNGILAEGTSAPPAHGMADTVITSMTLRFPSCELSYSVEGLAFLAALQPDNAPLQRLRAFEVTLLTLLTDLQS